MVKVSGDIQYSRWGCGTIVVCVRQAGGYGRQQIETVGMGVCGGQDTEGRLGDF